MLTIPYAPVVQEFPSLYILGETNAEVRIDTAEENRNAAASLAKQARYSLDIFSQDLDAAILNNKEFERCIFNLARRHPTAEIRILTKDSMKAVRQGHCLIRLAQTLTSSVFIHNPSKEYQKEMSAFLVADGVGLLYRNRGIEHNYDAAFNFMSPQRAGELVEYFDEAWERSLPDPQVRRLYM